MNQEQRLRQAPYAELKPYDSAIGLDYAYRANLARTAMLAGELVSTSGSTPGDAAPLFEGLVNLAGVFIGRNTHGAIEVQLEHNGFYDKDSYSWGQSHR